MTTHDWDTVLTGCLLGLVFFAVMAIFTGWLVTVVLGWFGWHFAIWQGWVVAFTISLLFNSSNSTNSK